MILTRSAGHRSPLRHPRHCDAQWPVSTCPGFVDWPIIASQPGQMLLAHELFEPACLQDPYPLYDRLRTVAPVAQVGDSPFFVATSFDAVIEATARFQDFSSNLTATMWAQPDGTVSAFGMGEPGSPSPRAGHRRRSGARRPSQDGAALDGGQADSSELEPFIADHSRRTARRGRARSSSGCPRWPTGCPCWWSHKLLGLPAADVDRLVAWAYASTQLLDGLVDSEQLTASGIAAVELGGYLTGPVRSKLRQIHGDNLLGDLAASSAAERVSRGGRRCSC